MKSVFRALLALTASMAIFFSASALADSIGVGVVDMQAIFQSAPQIKNINDTLTKQFQDRKDDLMKMSTQLQEDIQKYQKNKAVMGSKELNDLKTKINDQEAKLREEQTKFQQEVFQAQNQKMSQFLDQVKDIVKNIAADKKLDLVLPKNAVLYTQGSSDITSDVLNKLK